MGSPRRELLLLLEVLRGQDIAVGIEQGCPDLTPQRELPHLSQLLHCPENHLVPPLCVQKERSTGDEGQKAVLTHPGRRGHRGSAGGGGGPWNPSTSARRCCHRACQAWRGRWPADVPHAATCGSPRCAGPHPSRGRPVDDAPWPSFPCRVAASGPAGGWLAG